MIVPGLKIVACCSRIARADRLHSHAVQVWRVRTTTFDPHLMWDSSQSQSARGKKGVGGYCQTKPCFQMLCSMFATLVGPAPVKQHKFCSANSAEAWSLLVYNTSVSMRANCAANI